MRNDVANEPRNELRYSSPPFLIDTSRTRVLPPFGEHLDVETKYVYQSYKSTKIKMRSSPSTDTEVAGLLGLKVGREGAVVDKQQPNNIRLLFQLFPRKCYASNLSQVKD